MWFELLEEFGIPFEKYLIKVGGGFPSGVQKVQGTQESFLANCAVNSREKLNDTVLFASYSAWGYPSHSRKYPSLNFQDYIQIYL